MFSQIPYHLYQWLCNTTITYVVYTSIFSWILQIKRPLFNINQFTSFDEVVFLPILDNHLHWLSLFSCPLKSLLQISTETTAIAISYQCIFFCTDMLVHMLFRTTAMVQCTTTNHSDPLYKLTWPLHHILNHLYMKNQQHTYIYYMHWGLFVLWWSFITFPRPDWITSSTFTIPSI